MGYRDVVIVPEKKLFFCVVSDMNPISRVDSYLTNMNMPWDKTKD
jgi:WD40 repeat protein